MADSTLSIILRPKSLQDVIGHTAAVAAIKKTIDDDKIPLVTLFIGPAGTGKTTLAKILARDYQGWAFSPSEEPDVMEINAGNCRKIDDIRDLLTRTNTYPMNGTYRIIIMNEVHRLTADAQEALLQPFEDASSATRWILTTTELGKLKEALRTRCTIHQLSGMDAKERHALLARAAETLGRTESYEEFEKQVGLRGLRGPRAILQAFEGFNNGLSIEAAITAQTVAQAPEYHEIALAAVYGTWDKPGMRGAPSLAAQLNALDAKLKKKPEGEEKESEVGDELVGADEESSRPEVARALRAVTAAFLKGAVLKGNARAVKAMHYLAHCVSPNPFDAALEYPATIAGLYAVNAIMQGK